MKIVAKISIASLFAIASFAANAGDSTSVSGASAISSSACPNLPGYTGSTPPPGMVIDAVGNCVPGSSTAASDELKVSDFSTLPVCAHRWTTGYGPDITGDWDVKGRRDTGINLIDSRFNALDSRSIYWYQAFWDNLNASRCVSDSNPSVGSVGDGGRNGMGSGTHSSVAIALRAPYGRAKKIGCAISDGGTPPVGAKYVGLAVDQAPFRSSLYRDERFPQFYNARIVSGDLTGATIYYSGFAITPFASGQWYDMSINELFDPASFSAANEGVKWGSYYGIQYNYSGGV